jgi:translation initiation factor SUI1
MLNNVTITTTLPPPTTITPPPPMMIPINLTTQNPVVGSTSTTDSTQIVEDQQQNIVHLRIQNRKGSKCLTFIEGIPESVDVKKFTQKIRRMFHCNCTFIEHPKIGPCIQLSGDFREELKVLFVKDGIVKSTKDIKIHGF